MKTFWLSIFVLIVLVLIGGFVLADYYIGLPEDFQRSYVGRNACLECHQQQASLFEGSHHDHAMDVANDDTVLADFDHTLEHHGLTSRMFRDGDRFMVRTDGPDGKLTDFEVKYVFGVYPLQQYMVEMPQSEMAPDGTVGRLQVLRESWDVENQRWFYLNPPDVNERLDGDDPLHWTGVTQRWNTSCAECHSTNLEKNYSLSTQSFHTTFSEIDVSCEACHGPGSLHVKLAKANSFFWDRNHGYGLAKLKTESNLPQVEMCGTCHSRRGEIQTGFVAGNSYDEHFVCEMLTQPTYHADGQIRLEDYVYGSFKQSKMFHQGIRCTDCHDPHSTKVKFDGNQLCTSCHQHPAGQYDSPNHHHHTPGTAGSFCVDCHMPETTYMSVDARRDHSLRVPRPDMSVKFSTPNACTQCHLEPNRLSAENQSKVKQYLDWVVEAEKGNEEVALELKRIDSEMANAVRQWYGETSPSRTDSYYEKLIEIRGGKDVEAAIRLINDRAVPAIIRATALLEVADDDSPGTLEAALDATKSSDAGLVSASLSRLYNELNTLIFLPKLSTQQQLKQRRLVETVADLLTRDQLQVRLGAFRWIAAVPPKLRQLYLQAEDERHYSQVFKEMESVSSLNNDRAESYLNLASIYQGLGQFEDAVSAYQNAILVDPNRAGPREMIAVFLDAQSIYLAQVLEQEKKAGAPLERLQSIDDRLQIQLKERFRLRSEEHRLLEKDLKRSVGIEGMDILHFQFAVCSRQIDKLEFVEKHLRIALEQRPDNLTYWDELIDYYKSIGESKKATEAGKKRLEVIRARRDQASGS